MKHFDHRRDGDRLHGTAARAQVIDLGMLVGTWVNFYRESGGISRVSITNTGGTPKVRVWGAGSPGYDWGEVDGCAFAGGVALNTAVGFTAVYDFGFLHAMLAAYLNRRLLVVDTFTTFQDGSGRSPYYGRDHFHLEGVNGFWP